MVKATTASAKKAAPNGKTVAKPAAAKSKATAAAAAPPSADAPTTRKRKVASDFLELDESAAPVRVSAKSGANKASSSKPVSKAKAGKEKASASEQAPTEPASKKVKVARPALTSARSLGTSKKGLEAKADEAAPAAAATSSKAKPQSKAKAPAPALKSALKPTAPAPVANDDAAEEDTFIHGFSSSSEGGADSSDEDDSDFEGDERAIAAQKAGKGERRVDVSALPTVARDDKSVKRKLDKARKKNDTEKGVLYLGRIPHGFYEDEMRAYFAQFGDVTRLRLARNRKTGASKHFAYIEMSSKSVAEIVAETMDNYLLMGHILKCSVVDPERLHPDLWLGANKKWRRVPAARVERMTHDKTRSAEQVDKANKRLATKESKRKDKIKAAGIDYTYDGFTTDAADVSMSL